MGESGRDERVLGLSLVACEGNPTSPGRVRAIPAQECERRVGTALAKNSRELDRVVDGYVAEFYVSTEPVYAPRQKTAAS